MECQGATVNISNLIEYPLAANPAGKSITKSSL